MTRPPSRFHGSLLVTPFPRARGLLCGLLIASAGCGPLEGPAVEGPSPAESVATAEPESPGPDLAWALAYKPPVACGTALPGPALSPNVAEATPGYAEELAALDLPGGPVSYDFSQAPPQHQMLVNYMLGRVGGTSFTRRDLERAGPIGRAVHAAAVKGEPGKVDLTFLRRGLQHFYLCSRPVPASLTELKKRYGDYSLWADQEVLECSRPKDGPRRLIVDRARGVFVAETLAKDGAVRETEVVFTSLRKDGQIDFAVYTPEGELSDRSTFATASPEGVVAASPYMCIACHRQSDASAISVVHPQGGGAGCRDPR